jgi:GGDEF domain-containing protein
MINEVNDAQAADQVRGHVEQALRAPLVSVETGGDARLSVSGAVGLALYPGDGETADALLAHADKDMYDRKAAGKHAALD